MRRLAGALEVFAYGIAAGYWLGRGAIALRNFVVGDRDRARDVGVDVVVSGQRTTVFTVDDAALGSIIPAALEQTGNVGQPAQEWELRDVDGRILELDVEVGHTQADEPLFLNPRAGVGG